MTVTPIHRARAAAWWAGLAVIIAASAIGGLALGLLIGAAAPGPLPDPVLPKVLLVAVALAALGRWGMWRASRAGRP